jgi:hypothetical protein
LTSGSLQIMLSCLVTNPLGDYSVADKNVSKPRERLVEMAVDLRRKVVDCRFPTAVETELLLDTSKLLEKIEQHTTEKGEPA